MALPKINPTTTNAWKNLQEHFNQVKDLKMKSLFAEDADRADKMTIKWEDFYVDFSKNRITEETINHLLELAKDCKLEEAIKAQFDGEVINQTEGRAVLHTALRASKEEVFNVDGKNVIPEIVQVKEKIKDYGKSCKEYLN